MADDSDDPAFDADEIPKLLMKAKSGGDALTFAFGLTAKPEDCVLLLHLRKPGQALKKDVKALPVKTSKTCFGTFTVAEGEVRLQPVKPVKGMIKQLKKRFRNAGLMKYTPVLLGPGGEPLDEDTLPDDELEGDEDDTTETMETVPEAPPLPEVDNSALKKRLAALVPKVQALTGDIADRLRQACLMAGQQINANDPAAETTLARIEEVLARQAAPAAPPLPPRPDAPGQTTAGSDTPPVAPPPPEAPQVPLARLQETMAKIIQRIRALPDGPARNMLGGQAREILGFINEGAVERAIAAIRTLTQDLLAAEKTGSDGGKAKSDPMVVWRDAKETVDVSISALQSALKGIDDPDLQRIADAGLNGITDGLQTRLMVALFDYNATQGDARAKAAATLRTRAAELRKMLDSDPIIALCEDNPFGVNVAIRGPLGAALNELENIAGA
ncbi:MAG TPA: hypothetical protein PKD10_02170 [Paracoccaceae bacterium]|nr:hypothetical protein [Paracoccaceae bacterium]HMO72209.1 hypothetical protein [Paracoccaceae bacterium]